MSKSDTPNIPEQSPENTSGVLDGKTVISNSLIEDGHQQPSILISKRLQPLLLFQQPFSSKRKNGFLPVPLPTMKLLTAYEKLSGGLQKLIANLLGIDKSKITVDFGLQDLGDKLHDRLAFQFSVEGWDDLTEEMRLRVSEECFDFIHILELKPDEVPNMALASNSTPSNPAYDYDHQKPDKGITSGTINIDTGSRLESANPLTLSEATDFIATVGPLNLGSGAQLFAGNSYREISPKTKGPPEHEETSEILIFSRKQVAFANYNTRECCLLDVDGGGKLEIKFVIDEYLADLLAAEKGRWLIAGAFEKKTLKNGDVEQKLVGKLSIQTTL